MRLPVLFLLSIFLLASCANESGILPTAITTNNSIVTVAPDVAVTLPQSPGLRHPVDVSQLVVGTYGEQKFVFQARIDADGDHLTLAGLDMAGQRSLGVNWSKNGITYETAPWIPSQLNPSYILADMILMYWPPEAVRSALHGSATLTQSPGRRTITKDGATVIDIEYLPAGTKNPWLSHIHYRNLARGYNLDIQSAMP